MPAQATIDFPTEDVRALFAQMDRAVKELNIPIGKALKQAGNILGRTMGTSSRVATRDVKAKKRVIKEVKGEKSRRGNKKFEVISWRSGSRKTFFVYAKNKREASKKGKVKIGKFALAKATWARIASRIGSAGAMGGATAGAKRTAQKYGKVTFRFTGNDPFVKMTNKLDYALSALRGGEQDVNTAMARAARGLSKSIDKQLERKLGAT